MSFLSKHYNKFSRKAEGTLIEILTLFAAIITPSFIFIWVKLTPELPVIHKVAAWGIAILYVLLYCLMHISKFVKHYLSYFFYGISYLVSALITYFAFLNDFSGVYLPALMMIVFYIALTFEKIRSLLCYLISVMVMVGLAVYIERTYKGIYTNNGLVVQACLVVIFIIALLNLFIRNESKRGFKESKENYQRLLDNSPDGIAVHDREGIVYVNKALVKLVKAENENELLGKSIFELLHPDDREMAVTSLEKVFQGEGMGYKEDVLRLANNMCIEVEFANNITTYNNKNAITTVMRDISERNRIKEQLIEAEAKYRNIVEGVLVGVYIIQNNKLIYVNKYCEDTFGYSAEELYNMDFLKLFHEEYLSQIIDKIQELLSGSKENILEVKGTKKDGTEVYILTHSKALAYKGEPAIIGMLLDITDQRKSQEKIKEMALYDSVTGLPNRYSLDNYLKETLEKCKVNGQPVYILFIDLDKFKIINDTMGHSFGDAVLQKVSAEIKKCLNVSDFIARYGGDEFIAVLKDVSRDNVGKTAQKIIDRFTRPLDIWEHRIHITSSIGISSYPMDSGDDETLIKYADIAMYQAKSQGRNSCMFYEPDLGDGISRRMQLESELRKAFENNEFVIYYQPQIDIVSGDIYGAEALIRWEHPEFGLVSPSEFIPIAEETGLIVPMGEWVLKTVCRKIRIWQESGLQPINVAVNVSYQQLKHMSFIDSVKKILKESELNPKYLELEITESVLRDAKNLRGVLDELTPLGVKLSVDDFGVGYSSLSMLQYVTINNLKIDMSFIRDIPHSQKAAAIVKTIIQMGKNLNCNITAEGVEAMEQAEFLRENNCNLGQGYLFSKPLAEADFEKLLKDWKAI